MILVKLEPTAKPGPTVLGPEWHELVQEHAYYLVVRPADRPYCGLLIAEKCYWREVARVADKDEPLAELDLTAE